MGRIRKFKEGNVYHIYQNTIKGGLIFYQIKDYLVYISFYFTIAKKHQVVVLGLCIMPDHVHGLGYFERKQQLSSFVQESTSKYVLEYNRSSGRKGSLFNRRFGSAIKETEKKIRTAIAYLFNNPTEKGLVTKAENYTWNFLAYLKETPPPSLGNASKQLRHALQVVQRLAMANKPLRYNTLDLICKGLDEQELTIFMDGVIRAYLNINTKMLTGYYKEYESMLLAINSNTGSEYDIRENTLGGNDTVYSKISGFLSKYLEMTDLRKVTALPESYRWKLYSVIRSRFPSATARQVEKYLHLSKTQSKNR